MPPKTKPLPIEEIPLPPEDPDFGDDGAPEEADEADAGAADEPSPKAARTEPGLPIRQLDFLDDEPVIITLRHPFREADGTVRKAFECRPLTFGQVQDLTRRAVSEDGIELVEIYALIASTDVATLRGLKTVDGEALTDAARDFLPRAFRGSRSDG